MSKRKNILSQNFNSKSFQKTVIRIYIYFLKIYVGPLYSTEVMIDLMQVSQQRHLIAL